MKLQVKVIIIIVFFFFNFWRILILFMGSLIPLFRLLVMSALGFKVRVYPLVVYLRAMGSSDLPLVQNLLTT